jgi:hypothetical protein
MPWCDERYAGANQSFCLSCVAQLQAKDVEEVELLACREGLNLSPTMDFTAVHTGNILLVGLQYSEVDKLCDLESSIQI